VASFSRFWAFATLADVAAFLPAERRAFSRDCRAESTDAFSLSTFLLCSSVCLTARPPRMPNNVAPPPAIARGAARAATTPPMTPARGTNAAPAAVARAGSSPSFPTKLSSAEAPLESWETSALTFAVRVRATASSFVSASPVSASTLTVAVWSRICARSFSDQPRASGTTSTETEPTESLIGPPIA
jgi:hypothetical protein